MRSQVLSSIRSECSTISNIMKKLSFHTCRRSLLSVTITAMFLLIIPSSSSASLQYGAGLAPQNVWFSKDPFVVGDQILISTIVFNGSPYRYGGVVEVSDNFTSIGAKTFLLESNSPPMIISLPWTVTSGEHAFRVRVRDDHFLTSTDMIVDAVRTTSTSTLPVLRKPLTPSATSSTAMVQASTLPSPSDLKEKSLALGASTSLLAKEVIGNIMSPTPSVATGTASTSASDSPVQGFDGFRQRQEVWTEAMIAKVRQNIKTANATRDTQGLDQKNSEITGSSSRITLPRLSSTTLPGLMATATSYMAISSSTNLIAVAKDVRPASWWSMAVDRMSQILEKGQSKAHDPFQYVFLFLLTCYHVVLSHIWLFYLMLVLIFYRFVRMVIQFIF